MRAIEHRFLEPIPLAPRVEEGDRRTFAQLPGFGFPAKTVGRSGEQLRRPWPRFGQRIRHPRLDRIVLHQVCPRGIAQDQPQAILRRREFCAIESGLIARPIAEQKRVKALLGLGIGRDRWQRRCARMGGNGGCERIDDRSGSRWFRAGLTDDRGGRRDRFAAGQRHVHGQRGIAAGRTSVEIRSRIGPDRSRRSLVDECRSRICQRPSAPGQPQRRFTRLAQPRETSRIGVRINRFESRSISLADRPRISTRIQPEHRPRRPPRTHRLRPSQRFIPAARLTRSRRDCRAACPWHRQCGGGPAIRARRKIRRSSR